ncbi:MAG: PAS domain-containing protein [Desulfobacula sp.]|uniref:ATP-binding protein n=1 Tax=Desulfobacula sp. TaxID=2593537 RepID=UPI0025C5260E|nr:ATP-binding protein [Desulfobacula sp.]MCD4720068.1 PAS domain-containing protein [Desulfobacula sp.]
MGYKASIRDKLIGVFILIKVIPLIILALFVWNEISSLSVTLETHVNEMASTSAQTTKQVANLAISSSIRALDVRSREAIERLTTDTARKVAAFLESRDVDIRMASLLKPDKDLYQMFLNVHKRNITLHRPWIMNEKKTAWEPRYSDQADYPSVSARNSDNELDFHYRTPSKTGVIQSIPIYLEMTYMDISGKEVIKVTTSDLLSADPKDISKKDQTFCRAETYFNELKILKPGEIYVSDVIGAYVKTHMIGPYTKKRADEMGIEFNPVQSGYAGKENPVGKRFQGLVRFAMPVVSNGQIKGYVTLALDHTHLMEFTDHIIPTEERYSAISDAASGNYAFMWDHKGRNISHPRDYFIVGYDPSTGVPAVPWLEKTHYEKFKMSDLGISEFLESMPLYKNQALSKPSSKELIKKGLVGLDCRYLNFAPQCDGWNNLTQFGGSGSFVIHWSGLKKLTTAATIPYFTGQYSQSPRGFGFITIGANVHEFHKPAVVTEKIIRKTEGQYIQTIERQNKENKDILVKSLHDTATRLTFYTVVMVILVIAIAVLMASALTGKITTMIKGISRFRRGEMGYRLDIQTSDEMGVLGQTFNSMADSIQLAILELEQSKSMVEDSNVSLKAMLSKIIDSMPSIIIGVDTRVRVTLWNNEARKMTKKSFETVEGQDLFIVFPLLKKEKSIIFSAIEQGQIKKEERLEIEINNERAFFDVTAYPLINGKIDGAVLRIDNITTRVYMEEMMIQTEKMQSIGGLAAGMAHEINSPLAGIIQSAQVIQNRTKIDMPKNLEAAEEVGVDLEKLNLYCEKRSIFNMIESILDAGRRAADIVANMLSFSRKSDSSFAKQRIEKIIDQTIEIIEKDYDIKKNVDIKKIEVIRKYSPSLPEVPCDVGKIQQVFFNILKNGVHAMMENTENREPVLKLTTLQEDEFAFIEIEDNGPGMDDETKTRIFEPFFTTKSTGVGTGLGLYISYFIIVENHKGTINVESFPGRGTKFTIKLPLQQVS